MRFKAEAEADARGIKESAQAKAGETLPEAAAVASGRAKGKVDKKKLFPQLQRTLQVPRQRGDAEESETLSNVSQEDGSGLARYRDEIEIHLTNFNDFNPFELIPAQLTTREQCHRLMLMMKRREEGKLSTMVKPEDPISIEGRRYYDQGQIVMGFHCACVELNMGFERGAQYPSEL